MLVVTVPLAVLQAAAGNIFIFLFFAWHGRYANVTDLVRHNDAQQQGKTTICA